MRHKNVYSRCWSTTRLRESRLKKLSKVYTSRTASKSFPSFLENLEKFPQFNTCPNLSLSLTDTVNSFLPHLPQNSSLFFFVGFRVFMKNGTGHSGDRRRGCYWPSSRIRIKIESLRFSYVAHISQSRPCIWFFNRKITKMRLKLQITLKTPY